MSYTVQNLIDDLTKLIADGTISPDEVVTLQTDPEGNGYYEACGIEPARRDADEGDYYIRQLTPELQSQGFTEDDLGPEDCENCVVIFP